MKTILENFTNYYRKNNLLDEDTIQKMEYTIKSFINEFSKFLIFSLLFLLLNKYICFLLCYIAFVTLRVFSGGIHCNGYWNCFITSLFSFLTFIYLPEFINLDSKILIQIVALSTIFPLLLSPVLPKIRKIKNQKIKLLLKVFSVITTIIWTILCHYSINDKYIDSILIAILLGNIQLIVPAIKKIFEERRKRYEKIS